MGDISTGASKVLTMKTVNPRAVEMEFAVSGSIATRAVILRKELEAGEKKPFTKVLLANIGDCHATGQNPLTFIRQVVATCAYPELIDTANFPDDIKTRARRLLQGCEGQSVGSYSASRGIDVIRQDVANYISKRDGLETSADDVILCSGVSDGIRIILNLLMTGKDGDGRAGIMIPVPQYPLYSVTITEFNACPIPYYLNEEEDWSLDVSELNLAINEIRGKCMSIALCVINPGNPPGQVLSRENIEGIIRFAQKKNS